MRPSSRSASTRDSYRGPQAVVAAYTPERAAEVTGVPADDIVAPPGSTARPARATILYSMGITQHTPGTDNVNDRGQPGHADRQRRPRGHRRQSPARPEQCPGRLRHGGLPNVYPGYQKVTDRSGAALNSSRPGDVTAAPGRA